MKKLFILPILIFTLGLALFSCDSDDEGLDNEKTENDKGQEPTDTSLDYISDSEAVYMIPSISDVTLSEKERIIISDVNDFSFNMFRGFSDVNNSKCNVMSPISVVYLLGMANEGASEDMSADICKIIGIENIDEYRSFCKKNIDFVSDYDQDVSFDFANCLYVNKDYDLKTSYMNSIKNYFYADSKSLDFSNQSSLDYVNKWCSDNTNGMITSIIEALEPSSVSYLLNAAYFKATWMKAFDKKHTDDQEFAFEDGTVKDIKMMHQKAIVHYSNKVEYKALSLPYGSKGIFKMNILLPNENYGVNDIIKSLNSEEWKKLEEGWSTVLADIRIPVFESESDNIMNEVLSDLGLSSIFSPSLCPFPYICEQGDLYLSNIKQKTKISVDENGTEASTNTTGSMAVTGGDLDIEKDIKSIDFNANHPFVYVVTDAITKSVYFIGKYCEE